ncbi:GGDEF domain-containing protein [Geothrix sp. 21YS21S-4]|uniref:GGDEF domain-containing protein n=1 Tax=Geothrix sp. 21YS21S-4 TaxID=3068889 RepID=UPI0027B9D022|nr:GGDEF domain-containing protein [Geothrix sp. 21YS21S-4]
MSEPTNLPADANPLMAELRAILDRRALSPRFQPILDLRIGELYGFEGLIRGPSDSVLQAPLNLLGVARCAGMLAELERSCIESILGVWSQLATHHRIFVNLSPSALLDARSRASVGSDLVNQLGLLPSNVVIELTESQPTFEYAPLLEAAQYLRALGFTIALDDLGEGFSSLRLWSELKPEFVKVDKHFVQGVGADPVKLHFLQSIRDLAGRMGARVVAEGIETDADLAVIQELGIDYGQGFLLGKPRPQPDLRISHELHHRLRPVRPSASRPPSSTQRSTAERLLLPIPPAEPHQSNLDIQARFLRQPELQSLPVVADGIPVGLLGRHSFIDVMSRPFSPELYGKRSCTQFMEEAFLVVDRSIPIHDLSERVVASDPRHILLGFVITQNGRYAGMGSGHDLMREITQMQLASARYANPLTQLPGNVPIHEHLEGRLEQGAPFMVCYCDLDHFKPYNDVYGYRRGDELIQWTGLLLQECFDEPGDFVGHVGGDDFILAIPEEGWEPRTGAFLDRFERGRHTFFHPHDLAAGGYPSEDRKGQIVFHPLASISIGVVHVQPGAYANHHEIATAASGAKKMAKQQPGCSCFLERRRQQPSPLEAGGALSV